MYSKPPTAIDLVAGRRRRRLDPSREAREELAEPEESYSFSFMCKELDLIDVYSVWAAIERTSQFTWKFFNFALFDSF